LLYKKKKWKCQKKIGSGPKKNIKANSGTSITGEVETDQGFAIDKHVESGPVIKDTIK